MLPIQGTQVWPLVGSYASHMPHGSQKKKKKRKVMTITLTASKRIVAGNLTEI